MGHILIKIGGIHLKNGSMLIKIGGIHIKRGRHPAMHPSMGRYFDSIT